MARSTVTFPALVIPSGQQWSNFIENRVALYNLVDFIVYGPATLPETVTVYVSNIRATVTGDLRRLVVNGAAITVTPGDAVQIPIAAVKTIALKSTTNVGADRTFGVVGQVDQ